VCKNEKRAAIDEQLVQGVPLRLIAKQSGTSIAALHRHKQHLPATLTNAKQAKEVAQASSLLERIEELIDDCGRIASKAERGKQWRGAVAALREKRSNIELLLKVDGQITGATAVAVNVNTPKHEFVTQSDEDAERIVRVFLKRLEDRRLAEQTKYERHFEPEAGLRFTRPAKVDQTQTCS
jgi:hypothetical protein